MVKTIHIEIQLRPQITHLKAEGLEKASMAEPPDWRLMI